MPPWNAGGMYRSYSTESNKKTGSAPQVKKTCGSRRPEQPGGRNLIIKLRSLKQENWRPPGRQLAGIVESSGIVQKIMCSHVNLWILDSLEESNNKTEEA